MKTLTLQGTEFDIQSCKDKLLMWQKDLEVETRVYVVDTHSLNSTAHWDVIDDIFIKLAENQGTVYTLEGFQKGFNIGKFDEPHYVIRFINQPIFGEKDENKN